MFLSLKAWHTILLFSKKLVFLDGTFLTGQYKGILVGSSGLDCNNKSFFIGFGIVDIENFEQLVLVFV